ncbi:MAG TPA: helix-turn-helix domain-containing protein [Gemmatimonadales bacterium]|nr:helix-turn-helix domain-containing protein [Gemmatimonadales bacterium]
MSQTSGWRTPQDLARMTGFSVSFIRNEIKAGELKATLVTSPSRPRQRGRWRISVADAYEYLGRLGFQVDGDRRHAHVVACAADAR